MLRHCRKSAKKQKQKKEDKGGRADIGLVSEVEAGMKLDMSDRWNMTELLMNDPFVRLSCCGVVTVGSGKVFFTMELHSVISRW